jgi:starch phosphorylase
MKAALNAVPQLSTSDGWWVEASDGTNGWTIPRAPEHLTAEEADAHDAEQLTGCWRKRWYPHYDRDERGVPVAWVERRQRAACGGDAFHGASHAARVHGAILRARHARDSGADCPPTV